MTSVTAGDVSVVVPTFNRAELLDHTLTSLEQQTTPPAEIIVVDDGSTDATDELLAARQVTVVRNPSGGWGPARARNAGLARVSTDYVAFVDSDDLLTPRALERLRALLVTEPEAPFAYGCALAVVRSQDGSWRQEGIIATTQRELRDPLRSLFVRNSVPASGALARTESVRRIEGYGRDVEWSEDHDFFLRLAQQAPPAYLPDVVCAYRRHEGNRYTHVEGGLDVSALISLAENDARLRPRVPDRLGVMLLEAVAGAVRSGEVSGLTASGQLLTKHPRVDRVLIQALAHARLRRASARLGEKIWRERPDIRDWLAQY
jgi:glycosyltransferase involved in cell wall biosynthesis